MMNNPMMGMGNIMGILQQLKANPMQMLMQRRMNIPQNIPMNDPQAILNHLVSTGQVSQQQINNAYQMAQRFK